MIIITILFVTLFQMCQFVTCLMFPFDTYIEIIVVFFVAVVSWGRFLMRFSMSGGLQKTFSPTFCLIFVFIHGEQLEGQGLKDIAKKSIFG